MNDLTTVVDAWLEAYAEADVERRMKLIEQAWAPEGRLVDPPLEGKGYAGLSDAADLVNTHYAGHTMAITLFLPPHAKSEPDVPSHAASRGWLWGGGWQPPPHRADLVWGGNLPTPCGVGTA